MTKNNILKEIKADLLEEFTGWWDMDDAKEVAHGYIIKALYQYDINEKTMLELESKLIDFCIKQGVK